MESGPPNDDNDPAVALRARLGEVMQILRSGDVPQAAEHLVVLIERSEAAGVTPVEASARGLYAEITMRLGQNAVARPHAERALEIMKGLGNDAAVEHLTRLVAALSGEAPVPEDDQDDDPVRARLAEALRALENGDMARGEALLTALVDEGRRDGVPAMEASAGGLLAQVLAQAGRLDEALPHAKRALEIAESHGQREAAAHFRGLVDALEGGGGGGGGGGDGGEGFEPRLQAALEQANRGDPAAACESLTAIADDARAAGVRGAEASARNLLAQILLAGGEAELAVVEARRAVEIATSIGDEDGVEHCSRTLREAEAAADAEPGAGGPAGDDPGAAVFAALQRAMRAVRNGDMAAALTASEEAAEAAKGAGLAEAELTARGVQAQLLASSGATEKAAQAAGRALALAQAMGNAEAAQEFRSLLDALSKGG